MYLADQPMGGTIGDDDDNSYKRTVVDFDISPLPDALARILNAQLSAEIVLDDPTTILDWGKPFATLGALKVEHIYDAPIDLGTLTVPALASAGTLMSTQDPTQGVKTINVADAVADDLKNRATRSNRSQYRIQFANKTDDDGALDLVSIKPNSTLTLAVEYLVP